MLCNDRSVCQVAESQPPDEHRAHTLRRASSATLRSASSSSLKGFTKTVAPVILISHRGRSSSSVGTFSIAVSTSNPAGLQAWPLDEKSSPVFQHPRALHAKIP